MRTDCGFQSVTLLPSPQLKRLTVCVTTSPLSFPLLSEQCFIVEPAVFPPDFTPQYFLRLMQNSGHAGHVCLTVKLLYRPYAFSELCRQTLSPPCGRTFM